MDRRSSIHSASDKSPSRSASSRPESESGFISGIIASRSMDSADEYFAENSTVSATSSLRNSPQMISGRGALISGMIVPKSDSEEIEYVGGDDLESGIDAPDSDYASYAPPNIFPIPDSDKQGSRSKSSNPQKVTNSKMDHTEEPVDMTDEARFTQLNSFDEKRSRQTLWYVLAFISLLLIGAVIAVGVVVTDNKDSNADKQSLTIRQQELSDTVASISDPATLADSNSPQAKAHNWLVHDDNLWVDETEVVTREMIVQRYVLAAFYFATSGPSWISNTWLQGHECDTGNASWTGINCNTNGQIRALALDRKGLAGTIPSEIGHLSKLENFILKQEPGLIGTLPSSVGKLQSLRQLGLSHGNLTGSIPAELYLVTSLSYINLESNEMSGTLSMDVSMLRALKTLVLSNNRFEGTIPFDSLASTNLEYLGLSMNAFTGGISDGIRDLTALRYLYLDRNEMIAGELPVALGGALNLRSINLDYTSISGRVPAVIGRLRQLEFLSMQGCKLQGSIPGEINLLTKLKTLNLVANTLTGELPNLARMTSLSSLMLVGNHFRGRIEDSFADLRSLEILFLSSNEFTGPIPTAIGRPAGMSGSPLRGLYLSENKLDGVIPESICDYAKLEALFVDENQLTGSIPSCIGNLGNLKQLYAFHNQLTGELPVELSMLRKLTGIGIEHNALVGDVSSDVCALAASKAFSFWSDCGGEAPALTCPCCNVCCPSAECI